MYSGMIIVFSEYCMYSRIIIVFSEYCMYCGMTIVFLSWVSSLEVIWRFLESKYETLVQHLANFTNWEM